jgi:hypothetical protein
VFYFDDRDLSWNSEDAVIQRVDALAGDLGIRVETLAAMRTIEEISSEPIRSNSRVRVPNCMEFLGGSSISATRASP